MRRLLAASLLLVSVSAPARATEWLVCGSGEEASISVLLGAMEVIAVSDIVIEVGPKKWSTKPGEGTLITKGQAFETKDQIWIDVTDETVDEIVARLRLFKAEGEDMPVVGGTLQVTGTGAWAVNCSGP